MRKWNKFKGAKKGFYKKPGSGKHDEEILKDAYSHDIEKPVRDKNEPDEHYSSLRSVRLSTIRGFKTIEIAASPNGAVDPSYTPYFIIDKNAPVIDANYAGNDNIEGNTPLQLQNNHTTSMAMDMYDVLLHYKTINYLYIGYEQSDKNRAYTSELVKGISEAIAHGSATMLTELEFYKYNIFETDLPKPANISGDYAHINFGRMAALIHYQCVLQNAISPIVAYVQLLSFQEELSRISFGTEASLVTEIYGLFKKTSFLSEFTTLGTSLLPEYFDESWFTQNNTLNGVPSRRTWAYSDALNFLITTHKIPSLNIRYKNGSLIVDKYISSDIFNSGIKKSDITYVDYDTMTINNSDDPITFEELVKNINIGLCPGSVIRYLRIWSNDSAFRETMPQSTYVNSLKDQLVILSGILANFTKNMDELRTFLDQLNGTGLVYWKKGFSRFVNLKNIVQYRPVNNVLLNNVIAASVSGPNKLEFNTKTQRWKFYTLYDKYYALPTYDRKSQGAFLTVGLRKVGDIPGDDNHVSSQYLLPQLFSEGSTSVMRCFTRRGSALYITHEEANAETLAQDPMLARLNPLHDPEINIKIPKVTNAFAFDDLKTACIAASEISLLIQNQFSYGIIDIMYKDDLNETQHLKQTVVNPTAMFFMSYDLEDVSSDMIVFARNFGPFRIATPDPRRTIGFNVGNNKSAE